MSHGFGVAKTSNKKDWVKKERMVIWGGNKAE